MTCQLDSGTRQSLSDGLCSHSIAGELWALDKVQRTTLSGSQQMAGGGWELGFQNRIVHWSQLAPLKKQKQLSWTIGWPLILTGVGGSGAYLCISEWCIVGGGPVKHAPPWCEYNCVEAGVSMLYTAVCIIAWATERAKSVFWVTWRCASPKAVAPRSPAYCYWELGLCFLQINCYVNDISW